MTIDSGTFPRTARYVASLPEGLDSFTDCQVRGDAIDTFWKQLGERVLAAGADGAMRELFAGSLSRRDWLPEVFFQTANLMVRDACFEDDAAHFQWVRERSDEVFSRPFYRAMMAVLSPTFVVMGAQQRWSKIHRGSTLATTPGRGPEGRTHHRGELAFPDGVFPELYLKGLEQSYESSITAARAKNGRVELTKVEPGKAHYEISWDA